VQRETIGIAPQQNNPVRPTFLILRRQSDPTLGRLVPILDDWLGRLGSHE
jgi:hypothetical protein